MSLLWHDRLQVFFAPARVILVRSYKGVKPKPATQLSVECEHKPDQAAWESPLAQLEEIIANAQGTEVVITLSNHFMRYAVLASQKNIASAAELHAYAEFHMREVFGERAAEWMISVSAWDPCSGGVCAAMPRSLFERLEELTARGKTRLKYIEPYLTATFDHWRKHFDARRGWFVLVETGRFCLALLEDGAWQRISNQRIVHNLEDELLVTLDQEAILFSGRKEAIETVYLFAPEHPQLILPEDCGWRVTSLHTVNTLPPPHYPAGAIVPDKANECAASG
ncbi:hypothetical protein [Nitrosovibrio tenuis]|uniref:Uncharacterized protein n=1 Tax=Nitrosovibrio tenuis TaxID=1233 RepID=A0A1H7LQ20_9PROT|nr:hypothetical protein [Nitrosovibrio tenuis]SEL00986.1 hypothetical protein SAMN05216387_104129 [Nitrosovibrio tenuis]